MAQVKDGKSYIGGPVPEDLARRFREDCKAQDRSVSAGLRRLLGAYFGEIDGPLNGDGAAGNDAGLATATDANGRDRVSPAY